MPEVTYIGLAPILAKGQEAVEKATIRSGEYLVAEQSEEAPVESGALSAGIHIESIESGGDSCTVTTSTGGESDEYAIFVHEGTGPHIIEAHGGGLMWPGAAHPVKVVHHPGTPANPFMSDALLAGIGEYERNMASAAAEVF